MLLLNKQTNKLNKHVPNCICSKLYKGPRDLSSKSKSFICFEESCLCYGHQSLYGLGYVETTKTSVSFKSESRVHWVNAFWGETIHKQYIKTPQIRKRVMYPNITLYVDLFVGWGAVTSFWGPKINWQNMRAMQSVLRFSTDRKSWSLNLTTVRRFSLSSLVKICLRKKNSAQFFLD